MLITTRRVTYTVLRESVELRQAPFVGWIHDLSAADPYFVLPAIYVLVGRHMRFSGVRSGHRRAGATGAKLADILRAEKKDHTSTAAIDRALLFRITPCSPGNVSRLTCSTWTAAGSLDATVRH